MPRSLSGEEKSPKSNCFSTDKETLARPRYPPLKQDCRIQSCGPVHASVLLRDVDPMKPTACTSSSWSSFTNNVCGRSATSSGRTEYPTSRCWRSLASPALSDWSSSASWDGQDTSSEWRTSTGSRRCCRYGQLKEGHRDQGRPFKRYKTLWRRTSRAATLTWTLEKQLPVTELFGYTSAHKARKTLKSTEQLRSWQRKRGGNSAPLLWIHSHAASVAACVRHELVFIPTWGTTPANDLSTYSSVVSTGESIRRWDSLELPLRAPRFYA